MMSWLKYFISLFVVLVIIAYSYATFTEQNKTQRTSTEVEAMLESMILGNARLGLDGGVNKSELVANLVDSVIRTQKIDSNTKIKYVFLDSNLKATTEETAIDSVQFVIETYKETKVNSRVVRRLSLDYISKRGESANLTTQFYFGVYDSDVKDVTISVPNLGKFVSAKVVSSGGGTATVDTSAINYKENTIDISLKGAKGYNSIVTQGEQTTVSKFVENQNNRIYTDSQGYSGELTKSLFGGYFQREDTKYLSNYHTSKYADSEGYSGTLTREDNAYIGLYSPKETKYVSGESSKQYIDSNGFSGTLVAYKEPTTFPEGTLFKQIKNSLSPTYSDAEGFQGNLSKVNEYIDTVPMAKTVTYSDSMDLEDLNSDEYNQIIAFDSLGRVGNLNKVSVTFVPNGRVTSKYKSEYSPIAKSYAETQLNSKPTAQGRWVEEARYEAIEVTGLKSTSTDSDLGKQYIAKTSQAKKVFEEAGKSISTDSTSLSDYLEANSDFVTKSEDTKETPIYITKWRWERTEGSYYVLYSGTVSKLSLNYSGEVYKLPVGESFSDDDYDTLYRGTVVKPLVDTREYRYSGVVTRPEKDTRTFTYSGIVTKVVKGEQELTSSYEYLVDVTYKPVQNLTVKEKEEYSDLIGDDDDE